MADETKQIVLAQVPRESRRAVVLVKDEPAGHDVAAGIGGAIAGGVMGAAFGPVGAVVGAAMGFVVGGSESSANGVLRLPLGVARAQGVFPPGHPELGQAYALHPVHPTAYVPMADFHRTVFEHKHRELMRLLVALGARRVRVRVEYGMKTGQSGEAELKAKGVGSIGAGGSTRDGSSLRVDFEERFSPSGPPRLPSDLLWFRQEQSWQGLAERRLAHGTLSAQATLAYESDHGVDAKLAAAVDGLGVKVKSSFKEMQRTRWKLDVEFAPLTPW